MNIYSLLIGLGILTLVTMSMIWDYAYEMGRNAAVAEGRTKEEIIYKEVSIVKEKEACEAKGGKFEVKKEFSEGYHPEGEKPDETRILCSKPSEVISDIKI